MIQEIDPTWREVMPGAYIDKDSNGHLFPTMAIRALQLRFPKMGWGYTRKDYEMLAEAFSAMLEKEKPRGRLYSKLTVHRSEEDERRDFTGGANESH